MVFYQGTANLNNSEVLLLGLDINVSLFSQNYFADKDLYSQSYSFSNSHVQMWELDHKESWVLKSWCFRIVVLEKTLESPLDSKEIKSINQILRKINSEYSLEGLMLKLKLYYFGHLMPTHWKDCDAGKDWRPKEKGVAEGEMVR